MNFLLAISGGVDSMVLLDIIAKSQKPENITIAHFNHGTRPSADDDELFVSRAAKKYGLDFVSKKVYLGENVSEAQARSARYDFLRAEAKKRDAKIVTAHHLDDVIESVAVNILRGTNWRGLTPMFSSDIIRPFIHEEMLRFDILIYASENKIVYREDPTNSEDNYLRNRIRSAIANLHNPMRTVIKAEILSSYYEQCDLRKDIESELNSLYYNIFKDSVNISREPFLSLDEKTALELLSLFLKHNNLSATTPELLRLLSAICNYSPGKLYNLSKNHFVKIEKHYFRLVK